MTQQTHPHPSCSYSSNHHRFTKYVIQKKNLRLSEFLEYSCAEGDRSSIRNTFAYCIAIKSYILLETSDSSQGFICTLYLIRLTLVVFAQSRRNVKCISREHGSGPVFQAALLIQLLSEPLRLSEIL